MRADGVRQAAIGIGVLLALGGPAGAQEWTAQEIVDRAVARADAQRDAQDDIRYRATFEAITSVACATVLANYPKNWHARSIICGAVTAIRSHASFLWP